MRLPRSRSQYENGSQTGLWLICTSARRCRWRSGGRRGWRTTGSGGEPEYSSSRDVTTSTHSPRLSTLSFNRHRHWRLQIRYNILHPGYLALSLVELRQATRIIWTTGALASRFATCHIVYRTAKLLGARHKVHLDFELYDGMMVDCACAQTNHLGLARS